MEKGYAAKAMGPVSKPHFANPIKVKFLATAFSSFLLFLFLIIKLKSFIFTLAFVALRSFSMAGLGGEIGGERELHSITYPLARCGSFGAAVGYQRNILHRYMRPYTYPDRLKLCNICDG